MGMSKRCHVACKQWIYDACVSSMHNCIRMVDVSWHKSFMWVMDVCVTARSCMWVTHVYTMASMIEAKGKSRFCGGDGDRQWKMCDNVMFETEKRIMVVMNAKN